MANLLLIEKQTGGYFKFTLNGDTANAVTSIYNDLLAVGNQLHFKTGNGANIIKEQFIYPQDVTVIASGTFTFTTVAQVWDKLIDIDYFAWLGNGGGGGGVDRFDDLVDTFKYTGNAGKTVIVDNSELKLVPVTLYNKRLFTELEDTPGSLVPNKMLVVNPAGTAVVLQDQPEPPETLLNSVGYFDYNDLITQTIPLVAIANTPLKLTNDTEGANTSTDQNPYGVSYVWDYTTNQFNFSELSVGDTIDVRVHVQITTTSANQKVSMSAKFGIGSVSEFTNAIYENQFKTAGLHEVSFVAPFYMGSEYITDYPAELYLTTDASATVKVDGWYIRILRKNINIITVDYEVPDATTLTKGIVRLAGDLSGTANAPTVPELANKVPNTRTVSTTSPLLGGGALSSNLTLSIQQANSVDSGYLSNTDWSTFYGKADDASVVHLAGTETITGTKTFSSTVTAPIFQLNANNTIDSYPNYIGQAMASNDNWKIYGNTIATDRGELVFELGDNAASSSSNGQRFRFYYNNSSSGTVKSPFILDYNEAIFDSFVGIGTSSASNRLSVYHNGGFPSSTTLLQATVLIGDSESNRRLGIGSSTSGQWIQSSYPGGDGYTNLLLNPLGGKVGVGTSTPDITFEVAGGDIGVGNNAWYRVRSTSGSSQRIMGIDGGNNLYFGGLDSGLTNVYFRTGGVNQMNLDVNGNLGIGTEPENWGSLNTALRLGLYASLYDSSGSTILGWNTYNNGTVNKYIATGSLAMRYIINGSGHIWETAPSGTADANITYTECMRIVPNGQVGIGTDVPYSALHIKRNVSELLRITRGSVSDFSFDLGASNDLYIKNNGIGTTPLTILDSGNVGIGIISPVVNLHIASSAADFMLDSTGANQAFMQLRTTHASPNNNNWTIAAGRDNIRKFSIVDNLSGERLIINSSGFTKMTNDGTYYGSAGAFHEIRSNVNNQNNIILTHTNTSPYGPWINFTSSPNNATNYFLSGTDSTNSKFFIYSNGTMSNRTGVYGAISDIKYKENITDATSKLEDILQLKVRNFNFIGDESKQIGFIAQEFEEVFPAMVDVTTEKAEEGVEPETYKFIKTSVLTPILVKAMQELAEQVKELKAEIELLKAK